MRPEFPNTRPYLASACLYCFLFRARCKIQLVHKELLLENAPRIKSNSLLMSLGSTWFTFVQGRFFFHISSQQRFLHVAGLLNQVLHKIRHDRTVETYFELPRGG